MNIHVTGPAATGKTFFADVLIGQLQCPLKRSTGPPNGPSCDILVVGAPALTAKPYYVVLSENGVAAVIDPHGNYMAENISIPAAVDVMKEEIEAVLAVKAHT